MLAQHAASLVQTGPSASLLPLLVVSRAPVPLSARGAVQVAEGGVYL